MLLKFERSRLRFQVGIFLTVLLLSLGLMFRWINLDQKVFWVDEVATALRIAGYTRSEVTEALADGTLHTPADLLRYQQQGTRSLSNAVRAFRQSPEHAPLYFLLVRYWTQIFGSSVLGLRSFSVVCSLLLLGAMYWLSQLLFQSSITSRWATVLLAVSPFFIAYAQEARPYSLWMLMLVLSSGTLLNALKRNTLTTWGLYGLSLMLGLYTSLLTLSVAIGQAIYVHIVESSRNQRRRFSITLAAALVALLPWLWLVGQQWQTLQSNTTWMRLPLDGVAKAIIWFYSAAILYFDVPVITQPLWIAAVEVTIAIGVVALIIYAFYYLYRQLPKVGLFVLSLALPVPLTLILIDLISNGRYSTAPRYLLPFHLGSQLAVAYLFSNRLTQSKGSAKWRGVALFLVGICLISNLFYLQSSPRYLKNRNLHNLPIATIINQSRQPLILSEAENTIDLMSLSHSLAPQVQMQILPTSALLDQLQQTPFQSQPGFCTVFLFNPSTELVQQIQSVWDPPIKTRYHPQTLGPTEFSLSLWQLKLEQSAC